MSETEQPTDDVPDGFVRENRQHIRALGESLLSLEAGTDSGREPVDAAFRAAHSLKANCEMEGLEDAATVAHAVEDVLAAVRAGDVTLDAAAADEAMAAVEAIERVLDGIGGDDVPDIDAEAWTDRLRDQLEDTDADANGDTDSTDADDTDEPAPGLDDLDPEARAAFEAAGEYDDLDALVEAMDDDAAAYADLEGGGSFDEVERAEAAEGADPPDADDDETADTGDAGAEAPTGAETEATEAVDTAAPATTETASGAEEPAPAPDVAPRTDPETDAAAAGNITIPGVGRVTDAAATIAASSLDAAAFDVTEPEDTATAAAAGGAVALDAVRSLAVEERRLAAALDEPEANDLGGERNPGGPAADALASVRAATERLEAAAAADLRRVDALVPRLERAVERAAESVETPVAFEAAVAPVAVERAVVDRLAEPLVHCVRNAVDHGIESPRERGAAGKEETGTVAVRGRREGDRLVVTVADDGRGIDPDAVREAAVAAGIEGATEADDGAVLDLLFEAGVSTADPDSDLSGRGVGMDVVGRAMDALDGDVTVDSTPGTGTTVRLSVPVDGAVEGVHLLAAGPETYAVPGGAVAEVVEGDDATERDGTLRVPGDELERDAMGATTAFGETLEYPVVDLATALSVPEARGETETGLGTTSAAGGAAGSNGRAYLLVGSDAAVGGDRASDDRDLVALRCGALRGEHETLVTPLADITAPTVDGAVVCDAGRVVPVLDPTAFVGQR
ncbi:chemotaxis protein CheA [Haloglomus litoreum]|uniref:chemotaxis protein CheA n=1 Tax=Haloglomus litoreum TaxID=3034026 RepID=UPI0023E887B2|nr:ATP-binding protein [Haloglomus sp. DT116]